MAELFDSAGQTRFTHFYAVGIPIVFCSRLEAACNVISGMFMRQIVSDKCVKFCDPRLNCFFINSTQSHRRQHFRQSFHDDFRPEAASKVIYGVVVDLIGMGIPDRS